MRWVPLIALVVLALACGAAGATAAAASPAPASRWPSAADYQTIKTAAAVRDHLLFHVSNWREKAFGAQLALQTLVTVRVNAGPCATFVIELSGNLEDLANAYQGEKWGPLIRTVRHEPSVAHACKRPRAGWVLLTV
jgi:hypothetical protein